MNRTIWIIFLSVGIWAKTFAQIPTFFKRIDFGGAVDAAAAIIKSDSGYIIIGSGPVANTSITRGIKLIKVNETGGDLWKKTYGKVNEIWYPGLWGNVIRTMDGHYVFGGNYLDSNNFRESLIMKFTEQGDTLWIKKYRLEGSSSLFDVVQTADGNLAFCGFIKYSESSGRDDFLLIKTDQDGNFLWQKTYGWYFNDRAFQLSTTSGEGGFILSGGTHKLLDRTRYYGWLVWSDSIGQMIRSKEYYGNPDHNPCGCQAWNIGNDEQYMMSCHDTVMFSGQNYLQYYLARLNENGHEIWRTYLSSPDFSQFASLEILADTSVVVTGYRAEVPGGREEIWLEKISPDGQRLWERRYVFSQNNSHSFSGTDIIEARDGGLLVTGYTLGAPQDMFLLKLDSAGCFTPGCDSLVSSEEQLPLPDRYLHVWPSPASERLHLEYCGVQAGQEAELQMLDMAGRRVIERRIIVGTTCLEEELEVASWPRGLYVIALRQNGSWLARRRVVLW